MSGPDSTPPYSLKDATAEQGVELDHLLKSLQANLARRGIAPTSPEAKMHIGQLLQSYGIDPRKAQPYREMGLRSVEELPQRAISPEQTRQEMYAEAVNKNAMAYQARTPAVRASTTSHFPQPTPTQIDDSTIFRPTREGATAQEIREASTYAQKDRAWAAKQNAQTQLAWMKSPENVERATFMLAAKMRNEKGKGKGRWVPFGSLPRFYQEAFIQERGAPAAGFWTGDVGKRERQLANVLILQESQTRVAQGRRDRVMQASGTQLPAEYQLPRDTSER